MTEKKRVYEKPVIQDLGSILLGSGQMPLDRCSNGTTVSGPSALCGGGNSFETGCNAGGSIVERVNNMMYPDGE